MSDRNRICLEYLMLLVRSGRLSRAQELLTNPYAMEAGLLTKPDRGNAKQLLKELRGFGPEFSRLLDLHLVAHSLLFRVNSPDWLTAWFGRDVDLGLHFPGMNRAEILSARWRAVPVIVVNWKARLVFFITALFEGEGDRRFWPPWADGLMDDQCKSAIETSASAASSVFPLDRGEKFFCFPLLVPGKRIQLKGSSLGLGMAIGFLSAARNLSVPRRLVASGSITGKCGEVGDAEALKEKAACAEKKGFRVLLHPSCAPLPITPPGLETLPVSDLGEAWMFTQLYAPGKSRDLTLFSEMIRDADVFLNNVDMVDPSWLDWARRERMSDGAPGHLFKAPNGPARLVDKIGWALRNWKLDRAGSMAALVSPTGFQSMATSSALSALRFCTQNMALANHRGDVEAASCWYEKGERVFKKAMKADINACADFLNNRFVARHNRYDFSPIFPDQLTSMLRCLEERYAAQCRGGCMADRVLGELYGSICQNFGFCGPRYLSQCEHYAEMAVRAFGGGDVPELREDLLRQYCHIAYAELDAGDLGKAEDALFRYLETDGWAELLGQVEERELTRWQHALLARFLVETSNNPAKRRYLDWALLNRTRVMDRQHPSQLWLYNLGRIAFQLERRKESASVWEESLRLCHGAGAGPTISVMALLPLSGLLRCGHLSSVDPFEAKRQVLKAAETLNHEYFGILRQGAFDGVLQQVWEKPGDLFPFAYR
ncbi:MAG: hypothetical protein PHS17_01630 [Desulfobacterales bacterium]|nr:hypothetical protein [Desulfobacterales bacterium]